MFTRLSLQAEPQQLADRFSIDPVVLSYAKGDLQSRQPIPVLFADENQLKLDRYTWGIFPFWAKDSINAASETIHEKRGYKRNLAKCRCVIPSDAFYSEVQEGKTSKTIEYKFPDQRLFGIAGLYDVWDFPDGSEYRSATILTTWSSRSVSPYSERMPAILDESGINRWLDGKVTDTEELLPLLRAYESESLAVVVH
ncbi:SOS response-associated peptidase [Paenibacillus koleovorans]|uniref:SOS response-associated peptidase n=1 Tax=Paenibacillus koleovorans TaxID=121608 RepID=UPI000FDAD2B4|nr:SOS response-associated peptidase [Paenibacillus koleovorans]